MCVRSTAHTRKITQIYKHAHSHSGSLRARVCMHTCIRGSTLTYTLNCKCIYCSTCTQSLACPETLRQNESNQYRQAPSSAVSCIQVTEVGVCLESVFDEWYLEDITVTVVPGLFQKTFTYHNWLYNNQWKNLYPYVYQSGWTILHLFALFVHFLCVQLFIFLSNKLIFKKIKLARDFFICFKCDFKDLNYVQEI